MIIESPFSDTVNSPHILTHPLAGRILKTPKSWKFDASNSINHAYLTLTAVCLNTSIFVAAFKFIGPNFGAKGRNAARLTGEDSMVR